MKILLKIALIVTVVMSSCTQNPERASNTSKCEKNIDEILIALPATEQKETLAPNEIFILLSPKAVIYPKNSQGFTGKLISFNSEQITVKVNSNKEVTENINNISKIEFKNKKIVFCGEGKLSFRGENRQSIEELNLSLEHLKLVDSTNGIAKLDLEYLDIDDREYIKQLSLNTFYKIENLNFRSESSPQMELTLIK